MFGPSVFEILLPEVLSLHYRECRLVLPYTLMLVLKTEIPSIVVCGQLTVQ